MSGHSKWSTIKRDKAINDAKRSQEFTKIARLITIAAKKGGGDPDANPSLRLAIDKAKHARMPKDNIERAIKKGTGKGSDSENLEEIIYEGFGPGGVAYYIKVITDNRNRVVSEIRNILTSSGGSLGASGSTSYIFAQDPSKPSFVIEVDKETHGKLEKLNERLEDNDDVQEIYSNFSPR
ncbi:YebC/PmpR family DNA-binding transcriptional regulator [Patescibacteria group bacterium]|nr:YebC/PmpR family DNA-binding transcriptional regulator [Patescibacteria group bacterium]